jgi:hypothetical protein
MELRESEKGISKHDGEALAEEISFYLFNPCLHSFFPFRPDSAPVEARKARFGFETAEKEEEEDVEEENENNFYLRLCYCLQNKIVREGNFYSI